MINLFPSAMSPLHYHSIGTLVSPFASQSPNSLNVFSGRRPGPSLPLPPRARLPTPMSPVPSLLDDETSSVLFCCILLNIQSASITSSTGKSSLPFLFLYLSVNLLSIIFPSSKPQSLEDLAKPWAEYAAQQAIDHSLESAIEASKSHISQIRSTSYPHFLKAIVISSSIIITIVFFFYLSYCFLFSFPLRMNVSLGLQEKGLKGFESLLNILNCSWFGWPMFVYLI